MSAEEHTATAAGSKAHQQGAGPTSGGDAYSVAGTDHGTMPELEHASAPGAAQAGRQRNRTLQPCGSAQIYAVSSMGGMDTKIRAGNMSVTDPVYVRLEGCAVEGAFCTARVVRVGSQAPVRNYPMAATTSRGG